MPFRGEVLERAARASERKTREKRDGRTGVERRRSKRGRKCRFRYAPWGLVRFFRLQLGDATVAAASSSAPLCAVLVLGRLTGT